MYTCGRCGAPTENSCKYEGVVQVFHTCDKCHNRIEKGIKYQLENEHWHETSVICPHCDYDYGINCSYNFDQDEKYEKIVCPICNKAFELEVWETLSFSTKKHLCEMPKEESEAT